MMNGSGVPWDSLEKRSPALFLAAGAILAVYAVLYGLEAFTDAAAPEWQNVLLSAGYLAGFVGLIGLYPAFVDRMPGLARVAALVVAVPIASWVVLLAMNIGHLAGGLPAASDTLPGAFYVVHPVAMIVAYGLFGVAVLRTRTRSRTAGLLLLVPPLLLVALLLGSAIRPGSFPFGAFVISSGQAMTHLAVGYALQTKSSSSESESSSGDRDRELATHD